MNWNQFFTAIAYGAGIAVTVITTGGIAAPAWLIPTLTGVGVISGKMAASHSDAINASAAIGAAAGQAAKASSDATKGH